MPRSRRGDPVTQATASAAWSCRSPPRPPAAPAAPTRPPRAPTAAPAAAPHPVVAPADAASSRPVRVAVPCTALQGHGPPWAGLETRQRTVNDAVRPPTELVLATTSIWPGSTTKRPWLL